MRAHLKRWGAIHLLVLLFLSSWVAQLATQLVQARNEAAAHGQQLTAAEFWPEFLQATTENWQSEFLQLVVQGVLLLGPISALLFAADRNATVDDVARLEDKLDEITRRLDEDGPGDT